MYKFKLLIYHLINQWNNIKYNAVCDKSRRTQFVICGDILSCTGYAKSARALAKILSNFGEVIGVSLQVDPKDCGEKFPGKLISRDDLLLLARVKKIIVIHHATPEHFFLVPRAVNIGLFYWETRSIPRKLRWQEKIAMMDMIWAPTTFVAKLVRDAHYIGPVHIVPWAQTFEQNQKISKKTNKKTGASVDVQLVKAMPPSGEAMWDETIALERLLNRYDFVALAIQSLSPRKGIQLLLDEWRTFISKNPDSNALLILKLNFVHAHGITGSPEEHFRKLLSRYGFRDGDVLRIGLIYSKLSDEQIHNLHNVCDVYLTASLGEGFGGPIVEALQEGTPVIAPRHTGIADLIPESTPLAIPYSEYLVGLRDIIEVYPHSSYWNVIDRGGMAHRLELLMALDERERNALVMEQRQHAAEFCDEDAVRKAVSDAINQIEAN